MRQLYRTARAASALARRFVGNKEGVAGIEMAMITPFLLTLLCGGSEIAYYCRSQFQASQMASTVADAVSRYESLTSSDITSIFSVSSEVMGTSDFATNGYVILSSVSRTAGSAPVVSWQCKSGALVNESRVGKLNKAAILPGGLTLDPSDNVIIAEVFYQHTPIFTSFVALEKQLIKTATFRPRLGSLTTAPGC
jgi:hypothetical protein